MSAPGRDDPGERLRRVGLQDALQELDPAELARAYREQRPVYLGRGHWWRWERDGIPPWLVPPLQELGFLP
jgi:hypothetical protein